MAGRAPAAMDGWPLSTPRWTPKANLRDPDGTHSTLPGEAVSRACLPPGRTARGPAPRVILGVASQARAGWSLSADTGTLQGSRRVPGPHWPQNAYLRVGGA